MLGQNVKFTYTHYSKQRILWRVQRELASVSGTDRIGGRVDGQQSLS